MSQTLYRKYRSQTFADIIGQSSVVRILRNAIRRGRINHAYLFSGPRGTGKTSIARIFAKALNCLNPQDGDACGICDVCKSIAAGNNVDVVEIDAASNRGIDDIRDLRERVGYAPLELRTKVYIIDEVHMITREGFNALLKTLEEPPEHVVFALCTTESNKVPITILSRCVRFDFQRLPLDALAAHLVDIAQREGFAMELDSAQRLSQLAEGSARDAISLLDQLTVYCDGAIRPQDISELFQLGDPELTAKVVELLEAGKPEEALATWGELLARGVDAGTFLLQLADTVKQRFLAEPQPGWGAALEVVWQGLNLLKYDSFPALLVELTLLQAGDALRSAHHAPTAQPTLPEPARPEPARPEPTRAAQSPREMVQQGAPPKREPAPRNEPPNQDSAPLSRQAEPTPASGSAGAGTWEAFVAAVRRRSLLTYSLVVHDVSGGLRGDTLELRFGAPARRAQEFAQRPENEAHLNAAAEEIYGSGTRLAFLAADAPPTSAIVAEEAAPPNEPPSAVPERNGSAEPVDPQRGVTAEDIKRVFNAEEI